MLHHFLFMVFRCFNYLISLCPLLQLFNCTLLTLKPITPNIWSSGVNGKLTNISIAMQTFDSN